jgi:hypothetical protein
LHRRPQPLYAKTAPFQEVIGPNREVTATKNTLKMKPPPFVAVKRFDASTEMKIYPQASRSEKLRMSRNTMVDPAKLMARLRILLFIALFAFCAPFIPHLLGI